MKPHPHLPTFCEGHKGWTTVGGIVYCSEPGCGRASGPDDDFGTWENLTGQHPPRRVRQLGRELHLIYLRRMGVSDKLYKYVADQTPDQRDSEGEGRWDRMAADILAYQEGDDITPDVLAWLEKPTPWD